MTLITPRWQNLPDGLAVMSMVYDEVLERLLIGGMRHGVAELWCAHIKEGVLCIDDIHAIPSPFYALERIDTPAPQLYLDQTRQPYQLAVNLEEYQGGSYGVVVYPDINDLSRVEGIESVTDSDITFGTPQCLRGDDYFTYEATGCDGSLWHFKRTSDSHGDTHWTGQTIEMRPGAQCWWDMVITPNGHTLLASSDIYHVDIYHRQLDGQYNFSGTVTPPPGESMYRVSAAEGQVVVYTGDKTHQRLTQWSVDLSAHALVQPMVLPCPDDALFVPSFYPHHPMLGIRKKTELIIANAFDGALIGRVLFEWPRRGPFSLCMVRCGQSLLFINGGQYGIWG